MNDLISRQDAIELIHSLYPSVPIMRWNIERWEKKYKPYIEAEKALEMLPSAQKKGHWIKRDGWTCSMCGYNLGYSLQTNYCPNCGARMGEYHEQI